MRLFTILLSILWLGSCQPPTGPVTPFFPEGRLVDLTHAFDEQTIYWPTAEKFALDTVFEGTTDKGYYYSAFQYCAAEHGGTHLDAPVHFSAGKQAADEIPLERLIGQAVVVDVSEKALADPDYQVTTADFEAWEAEHGRLPADIIVLIRTGYAQFWPDRVRYMGTDEVGEEAVAKLHFPGIHPDAASWLAQERRIKAAGLDTPSLDYGQSTHFEAHQRLFAANIPGFENVTNLDQLPVTGALVIALPMKIRGGSGGPLRIVAMVPE